MNINNEKRNITLNQPQSPYNMMSYFNEEIENESSFVTQILLYILYK